VSDTLKSKLDAIWSEPDAWCDVKFEFSGADRAELTLTCYRMYDAPPLTAERLMALCDLFGTRNIDVDRRSEGGCESCDWGSQYGYELTIRGATNYVDEFLAKAKEESGS
jgi:hypothetical protein